MSAKSYPDSPVPSESPAVEINRITSISPSPDHHQLKYTWVMWCSKSIPNPKSHAAAQWDHKVVTKFSTAEQFWSLFNFLDDQKEGVCHYYGDICFFREGIKPDWDDESNKDGGRVVIIDEACRNPEVLMNYLHRISLLIVGHQFKTAADHVCGIFASRKDPVNDPWLVSVWLDNSAAKYHRKVYEIISKDITLDPNVEVKWYAHAKRTKFVYLKKNTTASSTAEEEPKADDDPEPTDD